MALDFTSVEDAESILREVWDLIDIVEVGTPFIIKEGLGIVEKIKKEYPKLTVLSDLKIMDAGEHESKAAFESKADIITVLGVSDNATIIAAVTQAKKINKEVMVDMICVEDLEKRVAEIDKLGVDYICVHTAFDVQATGKNPLEELQKVKKILKNAKTAVAGGVKVETLRPIIKEDPDIIIVGGAITGQKDKRSAVLKMKEIMKQAEEQKNEY